MPYPPTLPPATRVNTDPQFDNHPGDHNLIANALAAILAELGNDPSGAAADLTVRLATITPVGSVVAYAGQVAPATWLIADGSAQSRTTYAALFAAIGTIYGAGDGVNTFNLPDLRTRVPVGKGTTAPFTALNAPGGSKDNTLVQHSHTINDHVHSMQGHVHTMKNHVHPTPFSDGFDVNSANQAGNTNAIYTPGGQTVGFLTRATAALASDVGQAKLNTDGPTDNTSDGPNTPNTAGVSDRGTDQQGVAGTNANLPPYIVLNYIIKAA